MTRSSGAIVWFYAPGEFLRPGPTACRGGADRDRGAAWRRVALLILAASLVSACAGRAPVVAPTGPAFPAFEFPSVTPALEQAPATILQQHEQAWRTLQAGQARDAARAYADIVSQSPAFFPARAGLAYSELAERDYKAAVTAFEATLVQAPAYLPALAGRADALIAADRPVEAITALEALLAADPSRAAARARLESLRFGTIEALVQEGRQARQRGDLEGARSAWTRAVTASPDSAFMYRELAGVERQAGQLEAAREHLLAALKLDDRDASSYALLGDLESARADATAALAAYRRAETLDARPEYRARIAELERAVAVAALPEAYRAIASNPEVTRGEMAALLGVAFGAWLGSTAATGPLMTDVRSHWAQQWILGVAAAGLMNVFPNHTFQPEAMMRRIDLADVVRRTLEAGEARNPSLPVPWRGASADFSDLPSTHAAFGAASLAVGSGIMQPDPGQAFTPRRPVSGAEAVALVDRLASLLLRR